jgi:CO dehydrogenase maturation factor
MKIAFVWKGGSGKTTLTASFIQFLQSKDIFTIVIDADINVWLASGIGISIEKDRYLASENRVQAIRKYLIGDNLKIKTPWHMVKTTPPGRWSQIITQDSDYFFDTFCSYQSDTLKFLHVGTYEADWIGTSCYHTHLSVFENILSHTYLQNSEFLVTDMVAGNDAFSNTLFTQFDILCLIVEPTLESVSMVKSYLDLMSKTETSTQICIIANKIEDENDMEYLMKNAIFSQFIFKYEKAIKHARQNNDIFLSQKQYQTWEEFYNFLQKIETNPHKKLQELHTLHKKYMELDYIQTPLWDLSVQIDENFQFPWK